MVSSGVLERALRRECSNPTEAQGLLESLLAVLSHARSHPDDVAARRVAKVFDEKPPRPELRLDDDGEAYTRAEFEHEYGGLDQWEAAPLAQLRYDGEYGIYTRTEFLAEYSNAGYSNGDERWAAAPIAPNPAPPLEEPDDSPSAVLPSAVRKRLRSARHRASPPSLVS